MLTITPVPTTEGPSPNQEQDGQDSSALENRQNQPHMLTMEYGAGKGVGNLLDSSLPSVATSNQVPGKRSFHVTKSPSPEFPFNNCIAVHPSDFPKELVHVLVNGYPLTACHDKDGNLDPGNIGLSRVQRRWIGISEPAVVTLEHLPEPPHSKAPIFIHTMEIEVDFLQKGYMNPEEYFSIDMASTFIDRFRGIVMTAGRPILFMFHGEELQGEVKSVILRGASSAPSTTNETHTGVIFAGTEVKFMVATDATIKIKPHVKFPVSAATFAAGTQIINIYGGNFNALSPTCPCAIAERCLAAGSKKDEVNFDVPSLASDSTGNKESKYKYEEKHRPIRIRRNKKKQRQSTSSYADLEFY